MGIWKKVRGSQTFHHDRIIIWRVLNHRFFTNKGARLWGVNDGVCPRCKAHEETMEHMFFQCNSVHRRWATIAVWLMGSRLAPNFAKQSLREILYTGITRAQRNLVPLVIIVEMLASIWREHNFVTFRGDRSQIPIQRVLQTVETHCRALTETC